MDNQDTQLGMLLKELRTRLGYSIEDWARIFDVEPIIIASIEAGHEMPQGFLIALVQWFMDGLEHPQTPTEILPNGWQKNLPDTIQTLVNAVEQRDALIEELEETCSLQKQTIAQSKVHTEGHHRQIEGYLKIVSKQQDKIKALEQEKQGKYETYRMRRVGYALVCICLFLLGGGAFGYLDYLHTKQPMAVGRSLDEPVIVGQVSVAGTKAIVDKKEIQVEPGHSNNYRLVIAQSKAKAVVSDEAAEPLLAKMDGEEKIAGNEKLLSLLSGVNKGAGLVVEVDCGDDEALFRFKGVDSSRVVISIVRQADQQRVFSDTTQLKTYVLKMKGKGFGKCFYQAYALDDINHVVTGRLGSGSLE
jgi:DNA-binding XRE family transcriptional regulator